MKRILASIGLVLLFCSWALAQSSVWRVRKDGSTLYLGGTCHMLREKDFPLPAEFYKAYRASDVVVFETDIAALQDRSVQRRFLTQAMYTDGSGLDNHLSPRTFAELADYCKANGIPLETLRQLKPSMLIMTLTVMELVKQGATMQGVDQYFHGLAKKDGKGIEWLESVEEQFGFLASMADGMEDAYVSYSLKDLATIGRKFGSLADAWRAGDTVRLDELMVAELKNGQPRIYRKLITDRNGNWLPLIERYLKTPRTAFVLVGTGHLTGPDGILEALGKRGCLVERL